MVEEREDLIVSLNEELTQKQQELTNLKAMLQGPLQEDQKTLNKVSRAHPLTPTVESSPVRFLP